MISSIGVEYSVGRGRVLMLAIDPNDPSLAKWAGIDTFVRRVLMRRPEETGAYQRVANQVARLTPLSGPDLSWVRFLSRDMETPKYPTTPIVEPPSPLNDTSVRTIQTPATLDQDIDANPLSSPPPPQQPVAAWADHEGLPRLSRDTLEEASGIKIPSALFVLKVVLAYVLILVPLNWLICRFVFNRRELAWVVVPLLSFGFAIGVERAAAYDIGYNSACDEIDVIESYGDYPRAHIDPLQLALFDRSHPLLDLVSGRSDSARLAAR